MNDSRNPEVAGTASTRGFALLEVAKYDAPRSRYRITLRLEDGKVVVVHCGIHALWHPGRLSKVLFKEFGALVSLPKPPEWRQLLGTVRVQFLGVPSRSTV